MTSVRWLDDDEQATWRAFNMVSRLIDAELDRQLNRDSGMGHAQYGILVALSESEGGMLRMGDLADRLQFSPSRLSHATRRMESDGWVERQKCPTDGRGQEAVITPRGRRALDSAAPGHVAEVRKLVFDHLGAEQQRQLREVSEAMLDAICDAPVGDKASHADTNGAQPRRITSS